MQELKHLEVELPGTHLIEASAGTGKTYAIALLYLRLLVERQLLPQQILVVTYTEAATKELRARIRARIREALDVVAGGATSDHLLSALCHNQNGLWGDAGVVHTTLDRALKLFDTASIFTIHGFCLRALNENAFESGSRYDSELVTDQTGLLREVVDDFWRRSFFNDSPQLLGCLLKKKHSPDTLRNFARQMVGNPKLEILPSYTPEQVASIRADCQSSFSALQREWPEQRQEVMDLLSASKGLSRDKSKGYPVAGIPSYCDQMDRFISADTPYDLPTDFGKFCTSGISKGTKPTGTAPEHPLFERCQQLLQQVEQRLLAFFGELIVYCNQQLPDRKQQLNIRFFDDLLNDLFRALEGENGMAFSTRLRSNYPAALIDEFQDTDPVQYQIFKSIYGATQLPLFLIGDPKQAIYSFRGADIFAYIQAAGDVPPAQRFTLTSNWRSTPPLLEGFNSIFANHRKPFLFDQISYHPVVAGQTADTRLTTAGGEDSPLQIWTMPPEGLNVSKANSMLPDHVAAEIARLLQEGNDGTALIDGQALLPGDIAVIVRSHRQATAMRDALIRLRIPTVMRSDMTLFATPEAREICTLLQGILNPGHESSVRGALVTDILGRSGSDIARLLEDEQEWEACLEQFRDYHQSWHDKGFMVMTRLLMEREKVRGRLLRYPDGERRLTNLLHCFEVIHGKAHERGIGMEGLVTWFSERVSESADSRNKSEEHEIRLETDEKAVKILTIHVSKGLEYPVVFCPFLWGGIQGNDQIVTFHDHNRMVKDFGSAELEQHRASGQTEALAESLRLLYVAVTRAKYRCYLYGGKVVSKSDKSSPETSPLAYLFHASPATRNSADLLPLLAREYLGLSGEQLLAQLQQLADASGGTISAAQLPDQSEAAIWQPQQQSDETFLPRIFQGTIRSDWRVTSFTSLASHDSSAAELPDRDQLQPGPQQSPAEPEQLRDEKNIFTFPRGVRAGNVMHDIFEHLDFAAATSEHIDQLVSKQLELQGFEPDWQPCISGMVTNVITTPLPSADGQITLSALTSGGWLSELDFFFPLKFISSDQFRSALHGYLDDYQALDLKGVMAALQFKPVRGMLKGSMDLVFRQGGRFYLLDWKSNHLGHRVEEYGQEAMQREMLRHLYPLQYLLYTVALNRYLSLRVDGYRYETHFGGVYYLFLRGVNRNNQEPFGIFRDLPPAELVTRLTELLVATEGDS